MKRATYLRIPLPEGKAQVCSALSAVLLAAGGICGLVGLVGVASIRQMEGWESVTLARVEVRALLTSLFCFAAGLFLFALNRKLKESEEASSMRLRGAFGAFARAVGWLFGGLLGLIVLCLVVYGGTNSLMGALENTRRPGDLLFPALLLLSLGAIGMWLGIKAKAKDQAASAPRNAFAQFIAVLGCCALVPGVFLGVSGLYFSAQFKAPNPQVHPESNQVASKESASPLRQEDMASIEDGTQVMSTTEAQFTLSGSAHFVDGNQRMVAIKEREVSLWHRNAQTADLFSKLLHGIELVQRNEGTMQMVGQGRNVTGWGKASRETQEGLMLVEACLEQISQPLYQRSHVAQTTRADLTGSFNFSDIPPGDYYVFLQDSVGDEMLTWIQPVALPESASITLSTFNCERFRTVHP